MRSVRFFWFLILTLPPGPDRTWGGAGVFAWIQVRWQLALVAGKPKPELILPPGWAKLTGQEVSSN